MEYNKVKVGIKKAVEQVVTSSVWKQSPVVVVDYHAWEVHTFQDAHDAEDYIRKNYIDGWDGEPPWGGDEDEELVVISYCGGYQMNRYGKTHQNYKFYKEVNGVKVYRKKTLVTFQAECIINVSL